MRNETDSNLEFSYLEFKKLLGDTTIEFIEYFLKNWDGCKEMWVQHFRNTMEIFGMKIILTLLNNYFLFECF